MEPEVNGNPNKLTSYYDLFRVENGKIAEHRDVMETDAVLPMVVGQMAPQGIILCETERNEQLPESAGDYEIAKTYFYHNTFTGMYTQRVDVFHAYNREAMVVFITDYFEFNFFPAFQRFFRQDRTGPEP